MKVLNVDGVPLVAEISIGADEFGLSLTFESRSGARDSIRARNTDYLPALEIVLARLAGVGSVIRNILIDSNRVQDLPRQERTLGLSFPIRLGSEVNVRQLRQDITEAQRSVGRSKGATKLGGNNTKRIRIELGSGPWSNATELEAVVIHGALLGLREFGKAYELADESPAVAAGDPFERDPAELERSIAGHNRTQNALARYLKSGGYDVLSPSLPTDPRYDLAWRRDDRMWVCEVKSLRETNEEKQLRLGLGQVLRYRHLLQHRFRDQQVIGVLCSEHQPADPSWLGLCQSLEIVMTWPAEFRGLG